MKQWLENFWYHNKIKFFAVVFTLVLFTVSIAQCARATNYDYKIVVYLNNTALNDGQLESVRNFFAKYGQDLNGDGQVNVGTINCTYYKGGDPNYAISVKQKLTITAMGDPKAILYVTDKDSFADVDKVKEDVGGFFLNKNLGEQNGKAYSLENTEVYAYFYDNPAIQINGLYLSERIVSGTVIEEDKKIDKYVSSSETMLENIIKSGK